MCRWRAGVLGARVASTAHEPLDCLPACRPTIGERFATTSHHYWALDATLGAAARCTQRATCLPPAHRPAAFSARLHAGLACEAKKVLGAVVLSFANEPNGGITWLQYSRRVGCIPTLLTLAYDHVLEEPLRPHECLIDFIAVAPEARGKGVGAKLMAWAEARGAALLTERAPADVAARGGPCMTLWVAADNATATRLYQRSGYRQVKRTDQGGCNCIMSHVFKRFLGHPVWCKMSKPLPLPEGAWRASWIPHWQ